MDAYCPSPGRNQARFEIGPNKKLGEPSGWLGCLRKGLKDDAGDEYRDNYPSFYLERLKPCQGPIHQEDECQSSNDCDAGEACFCHGWFDGGADPMWIEYLKYGGTSVRPFQMIGYANLCVANHCEDDCEGRGCELEWTGDLGPLEMNCHTEQDLCVLNDDCSGKLTKERGRDRCAYVKENKRWECVRVPVEFEDAKNPRRRGSHIHS